MPKRKATAVKTRDKQKLRARLFEFHQKRIRVQSCKRDVAHGLTVSLPNRDRLTMSINPLKTLDLILSLSKDEGGFHDFWPVLLLRTSAKITATIYRFGD